MTSNTSNKGRFLPFLLDAGCWTVENVISNTSNNVQHTNTPVVYIYNLNKNIYYYTTASYILKYFSLLDGWTVGRYF